MGEISSTDNQMDNNIDIVDNETLPTFQCASTNIQEEVEEIKIEYYPTLEKAISVANIKYHPCAADINYVKQLMDNDDVIFITDNNWMFICPLDENNQQLYMNRMFSNYKHGGKWHCDKECNEEFANRYDNQLDDDDATPLCIHSVLSQLIIDCENPMNFNVFKLGKCSLLCENPTIYFIKKCTSSQKLWIFGMDNICSKIILWLNNNGTLHCKQHYNLRGCYHTRILDNALKEYFGTRKYEIVRGKGDYARLVETGWSSYNPDKLHSKQSIPVPHILLTKYDNNQTSEKSKKYYAYIQNNDPPKTLSPEIPITKKCEKCQMDWKSMTKKKSSATYYDVHTASNVTVIYCICPQCEKEYHIDGCMKHLFNYNDKIIITHELIIQLSLHITRGRCKTFTNYWSDLNDLYKIRGVQIKMLDKSKLISCWKSCVKRFEWFPTLGCKLCDPTGTGYYKVICSDGTFLVIKDQYAKNLYTPTLTYKSHNAEQVRISYPKSTRFITIPKIRRLWERKICNQFGSRKVDGKMKPLGVGERQQLKAFFNKKENQAAKEFDDFVNELFKINKDDDLIKILYPVLRHLAGPVDLLQLAHPQIIDKLMNVELIDWEKDETVFNYSSAVLHQMINKLIKRYTNWDQIPKKCINIMKSIGNRANEIRTKIVKNRYKESNPKLED